MLDEIVNHFRSRHKMTILEMVPRRECVIRYRIGGLAVLLDTGRRAAWGWGRKLTSRSSSKVKRISRGRGCITTNRLVPNVGGSSKLRG
jgi:hypothetical protein